MSYVILSCSSLVPNSWGVTQVCSWVTAGLFWLISWLLSASIVLPTSSLVASRFPTSSCAVRPTFALARHFPLLPNPSRVAFLFTWCFSCGFTEYLPRLRSRSKSPLIRPSQTSGTSDQTVPDRSDLWSDENALEDHFALELRSKPPLNRRDPDRSDP